MFPLYNMNFTSPYNKAHKVVRPKPDWPDRWRQPWLQAPENTHSDETLVGGALRYFLAILAKVKYLCLLLFDHR